MYIFTLGVDEAGRGAWAGPVVAACVGWKGKCPIRSLLADSKKMSSITREKTYQEIIRLSTRGKLIYAVGIVPHDIIDSFGIREANRLAMQRAMETIIDTHSIHTMRESVYSLLIDGRDNYQFAISDLPKPQYVVRGDSKIKQIMAASIVAKVTRDTLMCDFEKQFPGYGFAQHKGYGTQLHQKALGALGVCGIHRRTYRPISELGANNKVVNPRY